MKLQDLKLDWPLVKYKGNSIAQKFGENANPSYAGAGLKGHPAIDIDAPYDAEIQSASRGMGRVYKKFNENNPDLMKYRAPCEIIDLEDCALEITYGHCHNILCQVGQLAPKQVIATVGNTGEVYNGSHLVTQKEKEEGSTLGRHLHFQIRKLRKVIHTQVDDLYLQDEQGSTYRENGFYYVYKQNGFNGCIDPMPYFQNADIVAEIDLAKKTIDVIEQIPATPQQKWNWLEIIKNFLKSLQIP